MLPTVFLSLSGSDEALVRNVQKLLPDGLAYFYPRSFENGENLIAAMEDGVGTASFLACSPARAALASLWVKCALERARLTNNTRPDFRVLVFPVEPEVGYDELPPWMQEFWIGRAGYTPRDIARYIRSVLASGPLSQLPGARVYGRGPLVDAALRSLQDVVFRTSDTPNVVVIAGNSGIGRRTFSHMFLGQAFPASPELNYGPQLQLPQFADLADLYRALRQEIEPNFSLAQFTDDLKAFSSLNLEEQAAEIAANVAHFGTLGQAVTVVTGNGIFEDRGFLKPWVAELFRLLAADRTAKLLVISNRLLHENELRPHPNVIQVSVPPLQEGDIRALMIAMAPVFDTKPELPSGEVIRAIGGHPAVARSTVALVARKGVAVVNSDLRDIFNIQEEVLSESLDFDRLSDLEKDALSVQSWVPQIDGDLLKRVLLERHQVTSEQFADALSNLLLACLVETSGPNYLISSPVRGLFRRKHGYGSVELRQAFSAALKRAWQQAQERDELRAELFDAFVYMTALEGGTLPPEFAGLLLPSTLQEVVRDTYDRGRDDPDALRRVVAWGSPAFEMRMDETTREEILSYLVRAQTRLQDYPAAEKTLSFMDSRAYRSRFYLRSFLVRQQGDLRQAVILLRQARDVRKYMGRVIADLGLCFQRLGMWPELHQLIREEERHIDRNPALLNVRIGMWIAQRDFAAAEEGIRKLRSLPREDGWADSRTAMVLMQRDQDYAGAQRLLTDVLQRHGGAQIAVRRLRAIAAAAGRDYDTARADADFLKARAGPDAGHEIEARIKLSQGDLQGAERELDQVKNRTVQTQLLHARILDAKANAITTPLGERDALRREVAEIRARHRMVDEFE